MQAAIYKKGQGYWTRLMSAIAYGMLVLMGAVWLWDLLSAARFGQMETVYVQMICALLVIAVFGTLGFWLIGRNSRFVDFLIATEGEMKKVNWSTRREILGSTWVVIAFTFFIAIYLFAFDFIFQIFFKWIDVLKDI